MPQPWHCSKPGWIRPSATCSSGRRPCTWHGGWNWIIFKVHSNSLTFHDSMAARVKGLQGCSGHPEGAADLQASPHSPRHGRYSLGVLPPPGCDPPLGGLIQACSGRGSWPGAAPAGHGRQREHHLNEALRHCCRCPRDVTAEILLVCRLGPPSLPACEEEALLAWPLPGSPPPMLGSLTELCRLHSPGCVRGRCGGTTPP